MAQTKDSRTLQLSILGAGLYYVDPETMFAAVQLVSLCHCKMRGRIVIFFKLFTQHVS